MSRVFLTLGGRSRSLEKDERGSEMTRESRVELERVAQEIVTSVRTKRRK